MNIKNANVTLGELLRLKHIMEKNIEIEIDKFQSSTNIAIADINIETLYVMGEMPILRCSSTVKL